MGSDLARQLGEKCMMNATIAMSREDAHDLLRPDADLVAAVEKVRALDFTMLKQKLVSEGRTSEMVDEMEDLYRKFLALNVRYYGEKICPTGAIDDFWHAHILDTKAYLNDCATIFPGYLHHYPYFGLRGPDDKADLDKAFATSVDLFIRHFGIDPTAGDTLARSCRPQNCP